MITEFLIISGYLLPEYISAFKKKPHIKLPLYTCLESNIFGLLLLSSGEVLFCPVRQFLFSKRV